MESKRAYSVSAPSARRSGERGFAILLVFILVILLGVVVAALSVTAWHERVIVLNEENRLKAGYAATAGVADGENLVWNRFVASTPGPNRTIANFANYLTAGTAELPPVPNDGDGIFTRAADGLPANGEGVWLRPLNETVEFDGRTRQTGLHVWRFDLPGVDGGTGNTLLRITSFGEAQEQSGMVESVTQISRVAPALNPLDYATLSRDTTCAMMCHAEIDNAARFYNAQAGNAANYNSFDKVLVGSLRETTMRIHRPGQIGVTEHQSGIGGTLLTRGKILDKGVPGDYKIMPDSGYLDAFAYAYAAIHEGGKIAENGFGEPTAEVLDPADAASGPIDEFSNMYENYPTGTSAPAGYLPEDVPPVFPDAVDLNDDGQFSTGELQSYAQSLAAQGGLHGSGQISGGVIYSVADGNQFAGSSFPQTGNVQTIDVTQQSGVYTGNVMLQGTAGDPLVLDGTVVIDGDVVLSGYYEGTGQIYATGNVYIVGDLQHGDTSQYLLDESQREHGLLVRANGSILVNDFLSLGLGTQPEGFDYSQVLANSNLYNDPGGFPPGEDYPQPENDLLDETDPSFDWNYEMWSYTADQMAIFNRNEWQRTRPFLHDKFGNQSVANPTYEPGYVPTYYQLKPSDPIYIFAGPDLPDPEHGTYWNPEGFWDGYWKPEGGYGRIYEDRNFNNLPDEGEDYNGNGVLDPNGDLLVYTPEEVDILLGAKRVALTPTETVIGPDASLPWLNAADLKQMNIEAHNARSAGPLRIDAGLHSSNAIIMMARQQETYGRNFQGQVVLNGLLMAPNIAVNAYGNPGNGDWTGMRLNYDEWLKVFRNRLDQTQPVELRRVWTTVGTQSGDGDGGQSFVNRRG